MNGSEAWRAERGVGFLYRDGRLASPMPVVIGADGGLASPLPGPEGKPVRLEMGEGRRLYLYGEEQACHGVLWSRPGEPPELLDVMTREEFEDHRAQNAIREARDYEHYLELRLGPDPRVEAVAIRRLASPTGVGAVKDAGRSRRPPSRAAYAVSLVAAAVALGWVYRSGVADLGLTLLDHAAMPDYELPHPDITRQIPVKVLLEYPPALAVVVQEMLDQGRMMPRYRDMNEEQFSLFLSLWRREGGGERLLTRVTNTLEDGSLRASPPITVEVSSQLGNAYSGIFRFLAKSLDERRLVRRPDGALLNLPSGFLDGSGKVVLQPIRDQPGPTDESSSPADGLR